jgi:surface polysaccharide O-acyltransferase-like enzyme
MGTYLLTRNSGQFKDFFYDFASLNVIIASGTAFILLKWISEAGIFASPKVHALTRSLATSAFGIYLIHILVIELLGSRISWLHINSFMGNAIWSVLLVSTLVYIISYLIVRVMQMIPVIKHIVP